MLVGYGGVDDNNNEGGVVEWRGDDESVVGMPAVEGWPELVEVAGWLLMRDRDDVEAGVDRSGGVVLVVV
ncbi:hypothetical protein Tco_0602702, partial [Tanacetum coccineum]